jgi:hypothetical protein
VSIKMYGYLHDHMLVFINYIAPLAND